ncbi:MAG TPA: hypothetical protein VGB74_21935 [Actinoplanes sp.]
MTRGIRRTASASGTEVTATSELQRALTSGGSATFRFIAAGAPSTPTATCTAAA